MEQAKEEKKWGFLTYPGSMADKINSRGISMYTKYSHTLHTHKHEKNLKGSEKAHTHAHHALDGML